MSLGKKSGVGRRIAAVVKIGLIGLLSLILLVLVGFNLLKFGIYGEYYRIKSDVCINPGLWDGFVCQDICRYEPEGKFLISGYMMDHSASRIYVTDRENRSYYVSLTYEGEPFSGHSGGIALHGSQVYVVCSNAIHIIPLDSILSAGNGDSVAITEMIAIDNEGSSAYADENYLYVGEFCDDNAYVAHHPYDTPDGEYHAIIGRYSFDDLSTPNKVYSIREKVQGICFTPEGKVVLSTSFGLTDSYYYVYDESRAVDSGLTLEGAPVVFLCDAERTVKGPAMAEGLEYYDGKILTLTESASNKYIFGKFFFADKIVALDLLGD